MTESTKFNGFPKETLKFLKDLSKNNDKVWFNQNRKKYELFFLKPAKDFISAIEPKLERKFSGINAIPAVNKSIFKIHKDVRFSRDKKPFKTHMALWFWEGEGRRMDCSGFYFHLEHNKLMLGAGIYMFPKDFMETFRNAVVHELHGHKFIKMISKMSKNSFEVNGKHYKRTPRGFDAEHENSEYLLFNGLYVGEEFKIPPGLHTEEIIDYCIERFAKMKPLHDWLISIT
ncbi:MAG: DUF2461 domain-containing protein [Planctomycetes bacterium]|nr:DUF2461 domain-containing protein [Planctomycetota bacterium]